MFKLYSFIDNVQNFINNKKIAESYTVHTIVLGDWSSTIIQASSNSIGTVLNCRSHRD